MRRLTIATAAVVTLALAGCADGTGDQPPPTPAAGDTAGTPTPAEPGSPGQPVPTARPAPGSCTDLPEADDGMYAVADAGTAVVRREGDRLVIERINPATGWTHQITEQDDDDIEIRFRRNDEALDLEIDIDDGQLEARVCNDDDDNDNDNDNDNDDDGDGNGDNDGSDNGDDD